jgi:hypothetical protein
MATPRHSKKEHHPKKHKPPTTTPSDPVTTGPTDPTDPTTPTQPATGQPVFAQPTPSPDPTGFVDTTSDEGDYSLNDPTLLEAVPTPADGETEPVLTLQQVWGDAGAAKVAAITAAGQIVFHSTGDTGSSKGPETQSLVADKMVSDFTEADAADVPSFFFHLGDVVYNFGEGAYYYDQFYEPYRDYPAPIVAIAGNHDGVVYKTDPAPTLQAFLRNFCAAMPAVSTDAGGLSRTAQIQPGVFFTFDSPFVRILGIYSNVLEDPGVISSQGNSTSPVSDIQLTYLTAALTRCKTENYTGAVILAVHHPPFTFGSQHSGSPLMSADIDQAASTAGFWPHAVLSGHAHNYQRFTRINGSTQIPYIIGGAGGHAVDSIQSGGKSGAIRTPSTVSSTLTFESYDDIDYGYLRIIVTAETLQIEYHPASDGATTKTPDDVVTVNIQTRTVS